MSIEEVEKKKRLEKEEERNLMRKIRDLKVVGRSRMRRDTPTEISQPAGKRRKIGIEEYRRVMQPNKEKGEKRKSDEEDKIDNSKRRNDEEASEEMNAEVEEFQGDLNEKDLGEVWNPLNFEKERWEKMLEEREITLRKEEEERERRKIKAGRLEKNSELLRLCK